MKRTIPAIIFISFYMVVCMSLFSCANIISPGGGPRDSIPPRLIGSIPKDSALNVSSPNIVLTFDEYIQLQSVNENLILSPNPKSMPFVDYKLHNVTVKLKDSLEKNTTYSINFGNAIKDVNEGNLAREFTYVFSTGKTIDSNQYKGYVLLAETGKTDSTLLVVLHNNTADSSIKKNIPRYIAKLNSKGYFSFKYLPEGQFSVYVVPNDFSKKYDDSTKMFAFLNEPVLINKNTRTDTLYAYQEYKKKEIKSPGSSGNSNSRPGAKTNTEDKRLKYTVNLEGGQQDLLGSLQFSFNRPLKSWDSTKILLLDTSFKPLAGYKLSLDTGKTKISLEFPWKEKTAYRVIVNKDAVVDSGGVSLLKSDSAKFVSKREADYGSCRMRFTNIDLSKNPVLQLVLEGKIFESVPLTGKEFIRKRFQPGEFEVRVLFDKNKNGIWDPGSFREKKQPEIVLYFPKKLVIRADRDTDQNFVF